MEEKSLKEKVDESYDLIKKIKEGSIKRKELKIPRKAKVSRSKLKKGYIGIIKIDENMNISGEKHKLNESSYELKNGTFHGTDGREMLMWNGKHPVLIQPTWSNEPINVKEIKPKNETYGQKYIMARMLKAVIVKGKKGIPGIVWVILLGVGGFILWNALKGGA